MKRRVLVGVFLLCIIGLMGLSIVDGSMVVVPSTQIANCYANDGEPGNISLMLNSAKDGLSGYKMTIGFTDETVARINSVSFPNWTNSTNNVIGTLPGQKVTVSAADLNQKIQKGSVNVSLCSIDISGINEGKTGINVEVIEMTDDNGKPVPIDPFPDSSVVVYSVPPLESSVNAPRDMDHNGLLDDFNGNHLIDIDDVVVFFYSWSVGTTDRLPVAPFDYNKNGRVDVNDIVVFFEKYCA